MAAEPAENLALDDERRLIQEAQRGNLDALRPIFEHYAQPLYATAIMPRLGDTAAAEDVLRETFATAVVKIKSFEWQGRSVYSWLRQIAVNKAYDVHRTSKRQRALIEALGAETPDAAPASQQPDVALIAEQERQLYRGRIDAAMAAISERYRDAIALRLIEELPREECARRLAISVGTFDVLLFRAVRAFRKHFGERA